jgi:hypothetical protein
MPDTKAKGVAFEDAQLDGAVLGKTAANSGTIGFYGKTPVVQRTFSSAVHVTSNVTTSASFGTSQLAVLNEIQNTLIGLGVWATS